MDERQFDEFYSSSFGRITGQIYAMIGDRDEAQECVQEAFVRAWSRRGVLSRADHPEAWVRTTAYRLAVSRWRRGRLATRPADRALSPALATAPAAETRVALVQALSTLPENQRRAIVLHHLCDLSIQAVAREVGVPEGTVKARLSRGHLADPAPGRDVVPDPLRDRRPGRELHLAAEQGRLLGLHDVI